MVNVELQLLSTMLDRQDFGPIIRGDVVLDSFVTNDGQAILNFITKYRYTTDGFARFPTLDIVRGRFAGTGYELPDPDQRAELNALVFETKLQRLRADLRTASTTLDTLAQSEDPMEGVGLVLKTLRTASEGVQRSKHVSLRDGFQDVIADYGSGALLAQGIPWCWPSMQKATRGMQRKEFYVIAGRPKSRKTFVALSAAAHALAEHHARILFISPEMPPKQILLRFIAFLCGLRYTEFKNSLLDVAEESRLLEYAELYGRIQSESEDSYGIRLNNFLAVPDGCLPPSFDVIQGTNKPISWVESQIETFRPDIVMVDSFYRMKTDGLRSDAADWKAVTAVSRALKDLAMNSDVTVVGTHQMNRESDGKVGTLGNLALADAVGQDTDLALRVITGKLNDVDHSALVVLGGREIEFDGVLIRNRPCYDYSEVCPITDRKIVEKLLKQEDKSEEEEEAKKKKASTKKRSVRAVEAMTSSLTEDFPSQEDPELEDNEEQIEG